MIKEMSAQYWPSEGTTAEYDSMSVTLQDERQLSGCKIRKLNLTNNKSSGQRIITQFHYLSWPDGLFPTSPSQLLDMMKRLERAKQQEDNKSVVVMCGWVQSALIIPRCTFGNILHASFFFSDGVRRCGMFCAISIILEMLKTEQVVDIFQVVKALRLHNPDFVTNVVSRTYFQIEENHVI
jgi:protein tyrosine phosphatase